MNLAIGDTSQIFQYLKEEDPALVGVSSRNFFKSSIVDALIEICEKTNTKFDRVFICFSEQRTYLNDTPGMPFDKINVDYTLNVINKIKNISKKIIVYSTSELYNLHSGPVGVHSTPYYTYTPYIASKELMVDKINKLRHKEHLDIIIITPFTFNSPYRSGGFLYNRFLSVILEGKKIEIGNIDFERDMVHPSVVAKASFTSDKDIVVGSGVLTNIRQFYVDLLKNFSINYDDYVTENNDIFINKRKPYFASTYTPYTNLLNDTTNDIKKYKNSISKRHN